MAFVLKGNGKTEDFDQAKLRASLMKAGATDLIADKVVKETIDRLADSPVHSTAEIHNHAFATLHHLSKPAAINYSLKHALLEFGPDGFPFERFVAEIFKSRGYETTTDQTVKGKCVEHEVDVVAWRDDELIMVEAKFHNENNYKSDLKVALYVKARFEDLADQKFTYGGVERGLAKGILVTSTKFTEHAIRYGECQGLSMVGWNYPLKGNLHDVINDSRLHPLTGLVSLSLVDKKNLLKAGLILCKDVTAHKDDLVGYGIDRDRIPAILEEVASVCE